jgi:hypothetical protein
MMNNDSTREATMKKRVSIPAEVQRKLLLECGFKCSIPLCQNTQALEFHHINGDPGDNSEDNLLVLCASHHAVVHAPGSKLDRKACELLKQTITKLSISLTADKRELRRIWERLNTEEIDPKERGRLFESLAADLLASIPGLLIVERNARAAIGEVDILVRNEATDASLNRLGAYIIVECKARNQPVPGSEVAAFLGKMALNRFDTGFLFSLSGFTRDAVAAAGSASRRDHLIVLVAPDDITDMIESEDRTEDIKQTVERSLLAG